MHAAVAVAAALEGVGEGAGHNGSRRETKPEAVPAPLGEGSRIESDAQPFVPVLGDLERDGGLERERCLADARDDGRPAEDAHVAQG